MCSSQLSLLLRNGILEMLPLGLPVDYCLRKVPFFSSTASMDSWRAPLGFIFSFLRRRLSLVVAHRKETESAFSSLHAHTDG